MPGQSFGAQGARAVTAQHSPTSTTGPAGLGAPGAPRSHKPRAQLVPRHWHGWGGTVSHPPKPGLSLRLPVPTHGSDGGQAGGPHPSQGDPETTSRKGFTGVSMEAGWEWGSGWEDPQPQRGNPEPRLLPKRGEGRTVPTPLQGARGALCTGSGVGVTGGSPSSQVPAETTPLH